MTYEAGAPALKAGVPDLAVAPEPTETWSPLVSPRFDMNQKLAVSVVFVLAMFMSIMDSTIVNVALPAIGRGLHATTTAVSAIAIGYLVSLAVVIPASGWLGDRYGAKRVMLAAIVIFTVASALCGLAQTFGELVLFRVLQGAGGGMLTPVGMAMLFRVFPAEERLRAASILTTPTTFAPAIGPVLGGVLVTSLSWRWVFLVNVPIGIFALVFGLLFLREQETARPGRFDVLGFVLSGVGFAALMYGVSEGPERGWSTTLVDVAVVLGVVFIAVMVWHQLTVSEPILRLRLLGDRLFRSVNIVVVLGVSAFLGTLYLVALFCQDGLGQSALSAGLTTFPEAIGVLAGTQLATHLLVPRVGPRAMMAGGLVGVAIVTAFLSLIDSPGELWQVRVLMFFLGATMAQVFLPSQTAAFVRVNDADTGAASTIFNAGRQLGGAIGVAIVTTALTIAGLGAARAGTGVRMPLHPFHVAFVVAALLAIAGAASALAVRDEDATVPLSAAPGLELEAGSASTAAVLYSAEPR